jgi:choline kinase
MHRATSVTHRFAIVASLSKQQPIFLIAQWDNLKVVWRSCYQTTTSGKGYIKISDNLKKNIFFFKSDVIFEGLVKKFNLNQIQKYFRLGLLGPIPNF